MAGRGRAGELLQGALTPACQPTGFVILLLAIVLIMALSLAPRLQAAERELPVRETLESRLEALQSAETVDAAAQAQIETLDQTLEALEALEATRAEQQALAERVNQADRDGRDYRQRLQRLEEGATLTQEALAQSSSAQLEQRLSETLDELDEQQQRLSDVNRALINAQTLPERVQTTVSEARRQQQQLRDALDDVQTDDDRRALIETRLALLEARIELGQRQLSNSATLRDLSQAERELLARQVDINQNRLLIFQEALNQKRRDASEQAIAEASLSEAVERGESPALDRAHERNRALAQELLETTDRVNTLIRNGIDIRARLEQVRQVERTLNEQAQALRGSLLLSRVLRQQRQALPEVTGQASLQESIAAMRLRQFDIAQAREALSAPSAYIAEQFGDAASFDEETRAALETTLEARRDLLDQLDEEYGNLLSRAIDIQLNQQQLTDISRSVRAMIEEQLFWVANGQPLGPGWLAELPAALAAQVGDEGWRQALQSLGSVPSPTALVMLPILLLALALSVLRGRIKASLGRIHEQIGRLKRDTQLHTPRAVLLNLALASRVPLVLMAGGGALWLGGEGFSVTLGRALLHLALAWAVFALLRRLLVPEGLAVRHFHWPVAYVARLRHTLFWLSLAVATVVLIAGVAERAEDRLADQPVALLLLLAALVAMSVCMLRLILAHVPWIGVRLLRLMLGITLSAVPLALIAMIVSGYEYTALRLTGRFMLSLYILALWLVVEACVVRGLAVAARRLAYKRMIARRRARSREGAPESGVELIEEPPLDMEQVNQQSLRLSRLILFLALVGVLYLVWADLLGVLSYLDSVRFGAVEEGASAAGGVVSIADMMTALVIIVLMAVMARNLPGLLEVTVLSRLSLKQGSAYAITSLLSYAIVGGGVVAALSTLGVSWDKLQWLVAALSVGLGFGLQEIFANFISGLIILFERPIRIGDTITLGNLHGTVSRIRIRATTVTDFDRKEIIIPNKTFVTDQLINWSLSDNITRVVLTFGVAHGTELDRVHEILRRIADEHPKVLADPEPQVLCMAYAQEAFNFELRVFVSELIDRLSVTDEINRRVDAEFREQGLRVAFQQMDVWLHGETGEQRRVAQRLAGQSDQNRQGDADDEGGSDNGAPGAR